MDYSQLISILKNPPGIRYPVILPDFFVDHFVVLSKFEDFLHSLEELAKQGGGNLLDNEQFIRRGGNCVNTTSALHTLGVDARMIITTDGYGASLLKALVSPGLDMSHIHRNGRLSATVSLETEYQGRRINLMISDSGSASSFGFDNLTESDLELIHNSGLVALVNLNHNQSGAELAHHLFEQVKNTSSSITFMDMGDPSSNPDLVIPLARNVIAEGLVDVLSANENEISWLAWALTGKNERWRKIIPNPAEWIAGAKKVSQETGVQIDLHTPFFSATVHENEVLSVPCFQVDSKVVCGAGDAWNAGDIYGHLLSLQPNDRMVLANAIAAHYISSQTASHPTVNEILAFLTQPPILSRDGKKLLMHR